MTFLSKTSDQSGPVKLTRREVISFLAGGAVTTPLALSFLSLLRPEGDSTFIIASDDNLNVNLKKNGSIILPNSSPISWRDNNDKWSLGTGTAFITTASDNFMYLTNPQNLGVIMQDGLHGTNYLYFSNNLTYTIQVLGTLGTIYCRSITQTSDIRFKENIAPLSGCLEKLQQLMPVKYTIRDKPQLGTQFGLIGQDVKKVIPELVQVSDLADGSEDVHALNYTQLIPLLVDAIKTLSKRVEELEARSLS